MDSSIYQAVLGSDRAYFEAGARRITLPGGAIFHMPSFEAVTAGACAHLLDPEAAEYDPDGWIAGLGRAFSSIGRDYMRVYLPRQNSRLGKALEAHDFGVSREIVFAAILDEGFCFPGTSGFKLRRVSLERDWAAKLVIHVNAQFPADGKSGDPHTWVAFERRKAESGYMKPYLVTNDDCAVATFSIARMKEGLRIKNVVVDPRFRRRGAASAVVGFSCQLAARLNLKHVGLLAISGGIGEHLYRRLGLKAMGYIDEYYHH